MSGGYPALWDWRRQVAAMYAAVRAEADPAAAWAQWRRTRDGLFRDHAQTPIEDVAAFRGLPFFAYDPALRFDVALEPWEGEALVVTAGSDGDVQLEPFARTVGLAEALGGELVLYWVGGYGGGVLLPFTDATSGRETYGGGRYVIDTLKSADLGQAGEGRTVLDFNFAYNPSCAYSGRYICPLSPPGNRLSGAVRAGERMAA